MFHRLMARVARTWLALLCAALLLTGCHRQYPLVEADARAAMKDFLDTWQQGQPFDSLKSRQPRVFGGDEDWQGGAKLVRYEITEYRPNELNLICTVTLITSRPSTDEASPPIEEMKVVTYTVATKPVVTVFRN